MQYETKESVALYSTEFQFAYSAVSACYVTELLLVSKFRVPEVESEDEELLQIIQIFSFWSTSSYCWESLPLALKQNNKANLLTHLSEDLYVCVYVCVYVCACECVCVHVRVCVS